MEKKSALDINNLKLIFHHISDLVFLIRVVDLQHYEIEAINEGYLGNYQTTKEDISGKRIEEFLGVDQGIKAIRRFQEAIIRRETLQFEEAYTFPEQGYRMFDITLVPIIEGNTVANLIGTAKDITEKRINEEQLVQSEKLSVVGQLAAGIAHELKNPLTSLKGFLKLIDFENKNPDIERYIKVMDTEFTRIEQIIEEFLVLAKPNKINFCHHRIDDIIEEVIELLNAQANMESIVLTTEYPDTLPQVYCESNQLKQVFINIIKNAIEASDDGGNITISINTSGEHIQVSIRDHGEGISKEDINKLGSPFYTTKKHGTGLGLAICKRIIEKHKGQLVIDSSIGHGTEITVILPINFT
ncbi:ATP-binding protein [Guptibacillus algicola]|uniref:ATP-binding protein n=1 Tax=Guptibacillus algicola TaxID=225844 RepID=UPI001CD2F9F8|nr:ATP-binding protein [Alkalihalobacillus algicola]MCA0989021.1 PAS domain-containing protein [Alkalihalobacillus algicola]